MLRMYEMKNKTKRNKTHTHAPHQLSGKGIWKELSITTESCQEKSVQEKDRGQPAKEKEPQTAAEVENHCLKESFGKNRTNK